MAVVATGGYGRGLMAPESDNRSVVHLPYKQTAWGEQVAEAILYCLWDMGLKVGHATRSVDESIRQARGDMTIRTAILETRFPDRRPAAYDELVERFDREVVQGTAAEFVTAKLAEREERASPRRTIALIWSSPTSRTARAACATCTRCSGSPNTSTACARPTSSWSAACSTPRIPHLPPLLGFPVVGPLQHPLLLREAEERLSFDLQREIAVRLGYTSHPGMRMSNAS